MTHTARVLAQTATTWGLVLMAAAASAQAPDFSKVEIKTTKVSGNLYLLEGQGGAIGVLPGPDGVLMVDSQFAPLTDKIVAAVKQLSDGRIRFLVNTHVHGDHTGGNENLGRLGVTILARDELRARLMRPSPAANGTVPPPMPAAGLPVVTYRGPFTLYMNGEAVQLIPVVQAHTDGDTYVRFPNADVLMTGDVYRSIGYPNIDRGNGGTLKGILDALAVAIEVSGPATKVLPGHGPIADKAAVMAHRDMIVTVRDRVAALIQQGKTLEAVVAAKPTADFDARIPTAAQTSERFVGQVYAELKGGR